MIRKQYFDFDSGPVHQTEKGPWIAVAIAADSRLDVCTIDGEIVAVGAPLYLESNGENRSLRLGAAHFATASTFPLLDLSLLLISDPCAFALIPHVRAPLIHEQIFDRSIATLVQLPVMGRRHTTIDVVNATFGITGARYRTGGSDLFTLFAVGTSGSVEVGGTDNEECFDELHITTAAGVAGTDAIVRCRSYGELGR